MLEISNQACSEVYDIICHMDKDLINKLPKNFMLLIEKNKDENYIVNINYSKNINNQNLLKPTRVLLSLMYRDYLCTEEKRKLLIEKDNEQLKQIEAELSPNNLFKKRMDSSEKKELNKTDIVIYKETIFQKILKKVKFVLKKS